MNEDDRARSPAEHLVVDEAAPAGGGSHLGGDHTNAPETAPAEASPRSDSKFAFDLLVAIGVGGALGALSRYAVGLALPSSGPHAFPWSTLLVNVAGAVLIGFLAAVPLKRLPLTSRMRAMIGIGYCGGLTTFSSMSVQIGMQTSTAWGVGLDVAVGIAYTAVSIILGVLAVLIGWWVGQRVLSD